MAVSTDLIPVDPYIRKEIYPGYLPEFGSQPFVVEPLRTFSAADNEHYWMRETSHFGRGVVPGSIALLEDCQTWGTQLAAEMVGVPPTRGMVNRLAGTHVYLGGIPVTSPWEIQARAARLGTFVSPILRDFDAYWGAYEAELRSAYAHFDGLDLDAMEPTALWAALQDAYVFHRRGWYLHFEVMYALSTNYLAFYQLAAEVGLDPALVPVYLSGRPTFYSETDEQLWNLARRARELGVDGILQGTDPADVQRVLGSGDGVRWWAEFRAFLDHYGWRLEETCTIDTPSWIEDPTPALHTVSAFLSSPVEHDFAASQRDAIAERDRLIEEARSTIGGGPNLQRFDDALAANQAANFAWWNEDHNWLLDRRLAIPVRRVSLALGERLVADGRLSQPEDVFFLFKTELLAAMKDDARWPALSAMIPDRRDYFDDWRGRGPELPALLGSVPERIEDPLLTELHGLTEHFIETVKTGGSPDGELKGFPASRGVSEGVARVVTSASEIGTVEPGEILVCTGTTTEWTPVFGVIKACVCDTGGSLAHAAIVSREYGIPCVVGTAAGTTTIRSGDRIRVDGGLGVVSVLS